jgi:formate hydrogenlyase subunit 4
MTSSLLQTIGLSAVNILLVILLSPLLEGIVRKLVAFVHSRIGPPVYQPYLDILKLMGKEEIRSVPSGLFRYSALVCLAAVLSTAVLVPIGAAPPLQSGGDAITFIYLITLSSVMIMLSGISSASPYGLIGSSREMMMILMVEPVILIALITLAVKCGSMQFVDMMAYQAQQGWALSTVIVALTLFLAILAQLARLPFDTVEADQEIMEGPFVEQSGVKLAFFKWSFYAKELIFSALFLAVFLPWPMVNNYPLSLAIQLLKIVLLLLVVGVVHVVNPRLRVDQAMRYFGMLIFTSLIGLAFALVGS